MELEGVERTSPNMIAEAFSQALGRPIEAHAVPRPNWVSIFRAHGMQNPLPRTQMLDGIKEGWTNVQGDAADGRKGTITIDQAIADLMGERA